MICRDMTRWYWCLGLLGSKFATTQRFSNRRIFNTDLLCCEWHIGCLQWGRSVLGGEKCEIKCKVQLIWTCFWTTCIFKQRLNMFRKCLERLYLNFDAVFEALLHSIEMFFVSMFRHRIHTQGHQHLRLAQRATSTHLKSCQPDMFDMLMNSKET